MTHYSKRKEQTTVLETVFVAIFKSIWWLIRLPFTSGRKGSKFSTQDRQFISIQRQKIENLATSKNQSDLVRALIESDKLLDHYFKLVGYRGESFADRLRSAERSMSKNQYNRIWSAHKLRNQVVHQTNLDLNANKLRSEIYTLLDYLKNV